MGERSKQLMLVGEALRPSRPRPTRAPARSVVSWRFRVAHPFPPSPSLYGRDEHSREPQEQCLHPCRGSRCPSAPLQPCRGEGERDAGDRVAGALGEGEYMRRVRGGGVARQGARAPPPPRHGPAVLSPGPTGFLTITVSPQFSVDDGGKGGWNSAGQTRMPARRREDQHPGTLSMPLLNCRGSGTPNGETTAAKTGQQGRSRESESILPFDRDSEDEGYEDECSSRLLSLQRRPLSERQKKVQFRDNYRRIVGNPAAIPPDVEKLKARMRPVRELADMEHVQRQIRSGFLQGLALPGYLVRNERIVVDMHTDRILVLEHPVQSRAIGHAVQNNSNRSPSQEDSSMQAVPSDHPDRSPCPLASSSDSDMEMTDFVIAPRKRSCPSWVIRRFYQEILDD